ncbi:uncharacterized protein [Antedon mediterranea]|uniref:uncharacterized protein n=1 Tax=Antedon mediterranea TaxID=105859 RepID=UPI003AF66138
MKSFVTLFALIAVAAANCPPLWTSGGRSCYRYFRGVASFDDASGVCMDHGNCNGDMARIVQIESLQESIFLQKYLSMFAAEGQRQLPSFWINLRLQPVMNPNTGSSANWWVWGDGKQLGQQGQLPGFGITPAPLVTPYSNFATPRLPQANPGSCVIHTQNNQLGNYIWSPTTCAAKQNIQAFICEMPSGARPVGPVGPPPRRPGVV